MKILNFVIMALLVFTQTAHGAFPSSFPSSLGTYESSAGPAGTGSFFHSNDDGLVQYCGGDDNVSGACWKLHGANHATLPGDAVMTDAAGNTIYNHDDSANTIAYGIAATAHTFAGVLNSTLNDDGIASVTAETSFGLFQNNASAFLHFSVPTNSFTGFVFGEGIDGDGAILRHRWTGTASTSSLQFLANAQAATFFELFSDGHLQYGAAGITHTITGNSILNGTVALNAAAQLGQFTNEGATAFFSQTVDSQSAGAFAAQGDLNMTASNTTSVVVGARIGFKRTYGAGTPTDTTTSQAGLQSVVDFSGSGTLTNTSTNGISSYQILAANEAGGGTLAITNYQGMLIEADSVATGTNKYGIRILAQSGATNNFALHTDIGDIRLGTSAIKFGMFGATPVVRTAAYSPTNVTPDRAFDADTVAIAELADIVGTILADLVSYGTLQ